jgi:intracellular septation protein
LKLLLDFLPLGLFFAAFKYGEIHREWAAAWLSAQFGFMVAGGTIGAQEAPTLLATVVVVAATLLQVLILKALRHKIDLILWVSLGLVVVLGALTLYFHSETFIKWKPTGLYWAMALAFWASQRFWGRNLLQAMLKDVELPATIWRRMNAMWLAFFAAMGVLNLVVAYGFSTGTWATFKVFGATGLMLLFTLAQGLYLSRHLPPNETTP